MLVGTVNLIDDPSSVITGGATVSSGYLYMCAKDGNKTEGFTCAFTQGTASQMTDNKDIGTVITT